MSQIKDSELSQTGDRADYAYSSDEDTAYVRPNDFSVDVVDDKGNVIMTLLPSDTRLEKGPIAIPEYNARKLHLE